jgi:hypothetical protein
MVADREVGVLIVTVCVELYVPAAGVKIGAATAEPGTVTVIGVLTVLP